MGFIDGDDTVFNQIELKRRKTMKDVGYMSRKTSNSFLRDETQDQISKINQIFETRAINEYKEKLYKLMKVAYLHPTERELISNPNLIYYDSYG